MCVGVCVGGCGCVGEVNLLMVLFNSQPTVSGTLEVDNDVPNCIFLYTITITMNVQT